jgi:hypothetical protein
LETTAGRNVRRHNKEEEEERKNSDKQQQQKSIDKARRINHRCKIKNEGAINPSRLSKVSGIVYPRSESTFTVK